MINLKNKPITLFLAGPILGIGIVLSIGYALFIIAASFGSIASDGLGGIAVIPFIAVYLVQFAIFVIIGYFLLRGVYNWSAVSIIISTIACPLLLVILVALIAYQFNYTLDLSTPIDISILILFVLMPLVMGTVAYNDLRYRLPRIKLLM